MSNDTDFDVLQLSPEDQQAFMNMVWSRVEVSMEEKESQEQGKEVPNDETTI